MVISHLPCQPFLQLPTTSRFTAHTTGAASLRSHPTGAPPKILETNVLKPKKGEATPAGPRSKQTMTSALEKFGKIGGKKGGHLWLFRVFWGDYTRIIRLPVWGSNLMQMYGKFEGFPFSIVWVGNIMTPVILPSYVGIIINHFETMDISSFMSRFFWNQKTNSSFSVWMVKKRKRK